MARSSTLRMALTLLWLLGIHGVRVRNSAEEEEEIIRTLQQPQQPGPDTLYMLRRKLQEQAADSPATHKIDALPLADKLPTDMYAGLLNASEDGDKRFFYWLVAPEDEVVKASPTTPILIWLNGGPGCSSNDGFFLENGPLQFQQQGDDWKLVLNPHSWHLSPAWVLYIDQPVGTGLSITHSNTHPRNDEEVNVDFCYFLQEFLLFYKDIFPQDATSNAVSNPIYFSGESHAGHYIPSMMDYLLKHQADARVRVNLGGAAIGNGWVDPYHQYAAADAAYGMGLINLAQKAQLDKKELECKLKLMGGSYNEGICYQLLDEIIAQSHGGSAATLASMYDATKVERKGAKREFPWGHHLVESYLGGTAGGALAGTEGVLQAIHATEVLAVGQRYQECSDPPYEALKHQDGLGVIPQVVSLLEANVRLMFFNGMNDLVCNHIGTEKMLFNLPWSRIDEFVMAPRYTWANADPANGPAAFVHEFENLTYLKIPNSGHMMPADQPEVALRMMQTFLHNQDFTQSEQLLSRAVQTEKSC